MARGHDARTVICQGVASMFDALGAAHAAVDLPSEQAQVYLWRRESSATESSVHLDVVEDHLSGLAESARWIASATRRSVHRWIDLPYLAELPLVTDLHRLCYLAIGRARPFTADDERSLSLVGGRLAPLEQVRLRLPLPPASDLRSSIHLTRREAEVLMLLRDGLLARAIASRLGLSERTVHKHLANLYGKLGVHDRLVAVQLAASLGLTEGPDDLGAELA